MSCNACAYCCAARSGTGTCAAAGAAAPGAAAPGATAAGATPPAPAGAFAAPAPAPAAVFAAAPAFVVAGCAGAGARDARGGALWHAASSARHPKLTNRFDQLFTNFRLAVTAWIELRQRREALLHPFIVGAVLSARRIDFVQFDCLLLEREGLFLEQYIVLLQFVLGQILGPLGAHQVLAELAVQFGALESCRSGHVGHLVVEGLL